MGRHDEPHYCHNRVGRPAIGIEKMSRMYLLQSWFNMSDKGLEGNIYDSYSMRIFMGIDFHKERAPGATTLLHFRHLLEESGMGKKIFEDVKRRLKGAGLCIASIVDATIIGA